MIWSIPEFHDGVAAQRKAHYRACGNYESQDKPNSKGNKSIDEIWPIPETMLVLLPRGNALERSN
jgi:hypothetical protein